MVLDRLPLVKNSAPKAPHPEEGLKAVKYGIEFVNRIESRRGCSGGIT